MAAAAEPCGITDYALATMLVLAVAGFIDDVGEINDLFFQRVSDDEWISTTLSSVGDGLAFWRAERHLGLLKPFFGGLDFGIDPLDTAGKSGEWARVPSPPLCVLFAVEAVAVLTGGLGLPYDGESIERARKELSMLREFLASSLPDDSWQGPAAQAYVSQVSALQDAVSKLIDLDESWAHRAHVAAGMINGLHKGLGILKIILACADWLWTRDLAIYGPDIFFGEKADLVGPIMLVCVLGAVALIVLTFVFGKAINGRQAHLVERTAREYQKVVLPGIGSTTGSLLLAEVIAEQEPSAGGFRDALVGTSEATSLAERMPLTSVSAMLASDRVAATSRQKMSLSGYAYQYLNLAKQTIEQTSRSGVRQGRRSAEPPIDRPAAVSVSDAEAAEAAGAAAGTHTLEYVPVVTAMAPSAAQNPVEGAD